MNKQFIIQEPCPANWEDMQPVAAGKYCSLCQKNVIDFSDWSTEDIIHFLQGKNNVCGRIAADAVIVPEQNWWQSIAHTGWSYGKKIAAFVFLCFGLSACNTNGNTKTTSGSTNNNQTITKLPSTDTPVAKDTPRILGGISCLPQK